MTCGSYIRQDITGFDLRTPYEIVIYNLTRHHKIGHQRISQAMTLHQKTSPNITSHDKTTNIVSQGIMTGHHKTSD